MSLKPVDPMTVSAALLTGLDTRYPLLTAGDRSGCNTMTIGWCQPGIVWNIPVCTVYVRPERHTYSFMEDSAYFTVSVLPESMKETITFCGRNSGRDVDKFKTCGLTVAYGEGDAPYIAEAELVLVCKKIYAQDLCAGNVVVDEAVLPSYGAKGGWHRAYTGKIVGAYQKK